MNIAIFGATGPSGREMVQQALDQGHVVTALARDPDAIMNHHDRLKVVKGNILDPISVEAAVTGQDAVLSTLGTKVIKKNTIISDGTRNIIDIMKMLGVRRLIVETSLDVGDSRGTWAGRSPGFFDRCFFETSSPTRKFRNESSRTAASIGSSYDRRT
jgi:putative NADH-flavin reductase